MSLFSLLFFLTFTNTIFFARSYIISLVYLIQKSHFFFVQIWFLNLFNNTESLLKYWLKLFNFKTQHYASTASHNEIVIENAHAKTLLNHNTIQNNFISYPLIYNYNQHHQFNQYTYNHQYNLNYPVYSPSPQLTSKQNLTTRKLLENGHTKAEETDCSQDNHKNFIPIQYFQN